jgi:hypothetical protein
MALRCMCCGCNWACVWCLLHVMQVCQRRAELGSQGWGPCTAQQPRDLWRSCTQRYDTMCFALHHMLEPCACSLAQTPWPLHLPACTEQTANSRMTACVLAHPTPAAFLAVGVAAVGMFAMYFVAKWTGQLSKFMRAEDKGKDSSTAASSSSTSSNSAAEGATSSSPKPANPMPDTSGRAGVGQQLPAEAAQADPKQKSKWQGWLFWAYPSYWRGSKQQEAHSPAADTEVPSTGHS